MVNESCVKQGPPRDGPRHADLLLVTGPVSRHMQAALERTFDATPEPKLVIAVGECGPPTPIDLMRGILEAIGRRNAGAPGR